MTYDEEVQVGKTVAKLLRVQYMERMLREGKILCVTTQQPGMCSVSVQGMIHIESELLYPSDAMVAKVLLGVG